MAGASGGVDSTVLVRLLHAAGRRVVVAHVNYGLRGAESDADESFVTALAGELGLPVHVRRARPAAEGNLQENARDMRYRFFEEVARAEQRVRAEVDKLVSAQIEAARQRVAVVETDGRQRIEAERKQLDAVEQELRAQLKRLTGGIRIPGIRLP